jgi:hypothetical protein
VVAQEDERRTNVTRGLTMLSRVQEADGAGGKLVASKAQEETTVLRRILVVTYGELRYPLLYLADRADQAASGSQGRTAGGARGILWCEVDSRSDSTGAAENCVS